MCWLSRRPRGCSVLSRLKGILVGFGLGFLTAMAVAHANGLNTQPWERS